MIRFKLLHIMFIPLILNMSGCNDGEPERAEPSDVFSEILNRPSSPSTKSVSDHVDNIFGEVGDLNLEVEK